jgi:hypothetical protein
MKAILLLGGMVVLAVLLVVFWPVALGLVALYVINDLTKATV